jgi:TonB family protein
MREWDGSSRRRVPRFRMQAPVDVTVLRSGIPDTVPGRSMNVCERGIAAMMAGELVPGETVGVEVRLSPAIETLRARATVRYQDKLRCGLEFVGISAEQRTAIRDWAKEAKVEAEISASSRTAAKPIGKKEVEATEERGRSGSSGVGGSSGRGRKRHRWWWVVALIVVLIGAAVVWWRWNRAWDELEAGLRNTETIPADKARVQVPAEVMQKLLDHRVEPVYPPEARKQNLQAIIALDIVVSRDGSVIGMKALNGPDVLAKAAMDALRWWKFEPYRVNGEPTMVETTVAVEFKK